MKKLKLRAMEFGAKEVLTRDQLKMVTGGCSSSSECQSAYGGSSHCNAFGVCEGGSAPPGGTGGNCPPGWRWVGGPGGACVYGG